MPESLQSLISYVESNPLMATLMSGGAVVWLFANLRSILSFAVGTVKACISFVITNAYEDARGSSYYSIKMKQQMFNNLLSETTALWERTVNVDLSNSVDINAFGKDADAIGSYEYDSRTGTTNPFTSKAKMVNTYGFSVRLLFGKVCFVERSYKLDGQRIVMKTVIRVFFARKKAFMKKLEDAINAKVLDSIRSNESSNVVMVWNADTVVGKKMKRSLDSIFTKGDVHKELYNSIKSFIDNRSVYQQLNYPYNYCGLLHGVPGSGKTSTILAIASELKRDVHYINLSQTNSQQLMKALNDDPMNSIFVFEDIDAISFKGAESRGLDGHGKGKDKGQDHDECTGAVKLFGVSLSDLLNITDGLLASDGAICLFTTNHIECLDPAFLRAGRMNAVVEFTYMTPDVSQKMVEKYLGVSLHNMMDNIKPAELQEAILDVLLEKKTIEDLKSKFCRV